MRFESFNSYPRTYAVLKDLKGFCLYNPQIWNSFFEHTNTTKNEVAHLLSLGTNPQILLISNLTNESGSTSYGIFDRRFGTKAIRLRKNVVAGLEMAKLEETIFGTGFFLAVTILHELVHYCRYHKNLSEGQWEYGKGFERDAFNTYLELENANRLSMQFKSYFQNLKYVIRKK